MKLHRLGENDLFGSFNGIAGCIPIYDAVPDLSDETCWFDIGSNPGTVFGVGSASLDFDETGNIPNNPSIFIVFEKATYFFDDLILAEPPCMPSVCDRGIRFSCDWNLDLTVETAAPSLQVTIRWRAGIEIIDMYDDEGSPDNGSLFESDLAEEFVCVSTGGTPGCSGVPSTKSLSGNLSVEFSAGTVPSGHVIGAEFFTQIVRTGSVFGSGDFRVHGNVTMDNFAWTIL